MTGRKQPNPPPIFPKPSAPPAPPSPPIPRCPSCSAKDAELTRLREVVEAADRYYYGSATEGFVSNADALRDAIVAWKEGKQMTRQSGGEG